MKQNGHDATPDRHNSLIPGFITKYAQLNFRGWCIIYGLAAVGIVIAILTHNASYFHFDTETYFTSAYNIFNTGHQDLYRTPLYPILVGMVEKIVVSRTATYTAVAAIQWIVFLISSVYLAKILKFAGVKARTAFFMVLLYTISPNISGMNYMIVTESLSVALLTFMLWCCVGVWKSPRIRCQVALWALVLTLIMLRPVFIYLIPILVVYELMVWRQKHYGRGYILSALIACCVVVGAVAAYAEINHRVYGLRTISVVSDHNNYHIIRQINALPVGEYDNPLIVSAVDSLYKANEYTGWAFDEIYWLEDEFGPAECHRFINRTIADHIPQSVGLILGRIYRAKDELMFNEMGIGTLWQLVLPGFTIMYVIAIVWTLLLLRMMWLRRRADSFALLLWMLYMGCLATAIIGAPSDFGRLTMPCIQPTLIFAGWLLSHLRWRYDTK